jgi:hypothetical protein
MTADHSLRAMFMCRAFLPVHWLELKQWLKTGKNANSTQLLLCSLV